jgi:poly-gamma-glutamate capsule biosynthesis protein CapA/YwtB (metallophosphatase superfamily)
MSFKNSPAYISVFIIGLILHVFEVNKAFFDKDTDKLRVSSMTVIPEKDLKKTDPDSVPDTFLIAAVGDIMLGTNFPSPKYLPSTDPSYLLLPALQQLQNADFTMGNLEGTILDTGGMAKKCKDSNVCYLFRMPELNATILKNAGFDVLNLANNHSGDFGLIGRDNTCRVLAENEIGTCGLVVKPTSIIERKGIKIGVVGFAPNTGTIDINDSARIVELVDSLRPLCNLLVVTFHGGAEGRNYQHITRKTEFFYGEDRGNVYNFARWAIDAGADVVIGHGPHVPRAVDYYKGKFICYSLGNFCTYGRFSLKAENAFAPLLNVYVDKNGNFIKARVLSYIQLGEGGPVEDNMNRAYYRIRDLTKQDIPEAKLKFTKNGFIYPITEQK